MNTILVDDRGPKGEYAYFLRAHRERLPPLELDVLTNWRDLEAQLAVQHPELVLLDMRFDDGRVEDFAGDLDALARSARFAGDRQRAEAQLRRVQGVFLLQALRQSRFQGPIILFGTLPEQQSTRLCQRLAPLIILEGLLFEGVREALSWAQQIIEG